MRRLFHLFTGLCLVVIISSTRIEHGLYIVLSLFIIVIIIEAVRLNMPAANRLFCLYLGPLLRQGERGKPTGTAYYLGGMLITILLFERGIALFSIAILAVGDPAASTVGKKWGRYRIREKTIEGGAAFFMAALGAGLIFHRLWDGLTPEVMIAGAVAGTLAELLPIKVDDNLTIPLAASVVMKAALLYST